MHATTTPAPTSADQWTRMGTDMDSADAAQARLHAQLASRYRLRADDGDDAERVMVRFACMAGPASPLYGAVKLVHGAVLARYADGMARVRLLEGPQRQIVHVHQRSLLALDCIECGA